LANTVSADAVESLKQKHVEELQGLQAQAARAQELETELAKVRGAESSLRLEFDHQLAEEKRILSAKYDSEVNELCTTLESKIESRDAQISELGTLQKLDNERHDKEIGVWHARDRKVQSGLLGLEEALRGILPFQLLSSCSFTSPPHSLIVPAGTFPDSNGATVAALKEYRAEQKIVPRVTPRPSFPWENWLRWLKAGFIQSLNWAGISAKLLFLSSKPCGRDERCLTRFRRSSNGSLSHPIESMSEKSPRLELALNRLWSSFSHGIQALTWTNWRIFVKAD
jgi:hypothetical protein